MCIIKFKIDSNSFNSVLSDELSQTVTYAGQKKPFFEQVLALSVGRIDWYKNWEEIDGHYYCEVRFFNKMVLNKIANLTKSGQILQNCRVDVYMTTNEKYGYFQIHKGVSEVGFCIRDQRFYFEKLMLDVGQINDETGTFKITITESTQIEDEYDADGVPITHEKKVYSFFANRPGYEISQLNRAISGLKEDVFH